MQKRNCCGVIVQMIAIIPVENIEFIQSLEKDFESASYKAPEDTVQWDRVSETLYEYLPEPKEDWEFEVLSIFTTHSIETIKKMIEEDKNRGEESYE